MLQPTQKVIAYILRRERSYWELLTFTEPHFPQAGWQVPGGTVEIREPLEKALYREVKEESGLEEFAEVRYLGMTQYGEIGTPGIQHRHFYQLVFTGVSPAQFDHFVTGNDGDAGMLFRYRWVRLADCPPLVGGRGAQLRALILDDVPMSQ